MKRETRGGWSSSCGGGGAGGSSRSTTAPNAGVGALGCVPAVAGAAAASLGSLAVAALLHWGQPADALATLKSLRADAVPPSVGSFDMIIQAAARARDRRAAYRAYRELRRSQLR